jgi:hypothetical protein
MSGSAAFQIHPEIDHCAGDPHQEVFAQCRRPEKECVGAEGMATVCVHACMAAGASH